MTTVVDYGAGNLRSVCNTLEALGAAYEVTNQPESVIRANKIILPGVGHFGQMIRALDELELREPLLDCIRKGVPFLGICVGLQCLFEGSEESPGSRGFGVFPGVVRRFMGDARVPHMGWNSLEPVRPSRLLEGLTGEPFTYFAHSYYAPVISETVVKCTYTQPYSAIMERDNLFAVQFHPEKSGTVGQHVVRNFLKLPCSQRELSPA
jgi:imidazole glycerol phosphate synthase glutamine amidotransferase subunit